MTVASATAQLAVAHRRRLREVWRSAGWPCRDGIELDLLAAALLHSRYDEQGRETLHVTEAGLQLLAATRKRNQAAFDAHEALVACVALQMRRAGRIAWRSLSLRAPLAPAEPGGSTRWAIAMPDVYSIRNTTVEDYTEPVAHEIKVSRADLLSDLRSASKGAAYLALSSQCWYVLRAGIATADEVPPAFGVMFAEGETLSVERPAPRRAMRLPFPVWMALARATPERWDDDDPQPGLAPHDGREDAPPAG